MVAPTTADRERTAGTGCRVGIEAHCTIVRLVCWTARMQSVFRRGLALFAIGGAFVTAGTVTDVNAGSRSAGAPIPEVTVGVDWRRVAVAPDVSLRSIAVAGDGLWVAGVRGNVEPERQGPVLLWSGDGEQWDEHDLAALGVPRVTLCGTVDERVCHPADMLLTADTVTGEIVVVIDNSGNDEPAVRDRWVVRGNAKALVAVDVSPAYTEWPAPDAMGIGLTGGAPQAVAAADGRVVALGAARRASYQPLALHLIGPGAAAVVVSDESVPFGVSRRYHAVAGVHHGTSGYLAIGSDNGDDGRFLPVSWRSVDGLVWERSVMAEPPASSEASISAYTTALGPSGVVAGGALRPEGFVSDAINAVLWHSSDGVAWQQIVLDEFAGSVTSVAAHGDRYLAYVRTDDGPIMLESPDGIEWRLLDPDVPDLGRLTPWGDGLVATLAGNVLISKPGFTGGSDAREQLEPAPIVLTGATEPTTVADVGVFWHAVELPAGVALDARNQAPWMVVAGERLWATGYRDGTLTLLSTADAAAWTEHDLAAAGVPHDWLVDSGDWELYNSRMLIADGTAVVLVLSRYPSDNETIPPQLLVVRSDGETIDVRLPESFDLGAWPGPENGDDLRYGAPVTGVAHDGRLVLSGRGQWWQPYDTGDSSIIVTVIEPDGRVSFVAQSGPPLGGWGWQVGVAMHVVDGQYMLIGRSPLDTTSDAQTKLVTWTSPDGSTWVGPHPGGSEIVSDDPDGAVRGPGGLLAYGEAVVPAGDETLTQPVMWWHSTDGVTWSPQLPALAASGERIASTWVFDGRFFSIVRGRSHNVLLASSDGVGWERVATFVPEVTKVQPWDNGVVGVVATTSGPIIYVSRPGVVAGTLATR